MDKKILLGGAAALLLAGNMYATPASAAIDLSIGGEAKLTAVMDDHCFTRGVASDDLRDVIGQFLGGRDVTGDDDMNDAIAAATGMTEVAWATDADATTKGDLDLTFEADPCDGADEDNPVLGFGKELSIGASGTLANGLSVSFSDTLDLTNVDVKEGNFKLVLGGAFGTLTFKDGADSAVGAALVGNNTDITVSGVNDFGEAHTATEGTAGTGILWQAPSVGNLDLYASWAPNSADSGLDTAEYTDTFGFGLTFNADMITIGGGFEQASTNNAAGACNGAAAALLDTAGTAQAKVNALFGGDLCGDQTLMAVGASMSAGDIGLTAMYNKLDTDEADDTTISVGMSTSVTDYDIAVDWKQTTREYLYFVEDEQTVLHVGVSTALGDGVTLSGDFSTSDYDQGSQTTGDGATTHYNAEVALTVAF